MHGHGEHDSQHYVDKAELAAWGQRDPIIRYAQVLREAGVLESTEALEKQAKAQVDEAVAFADASPYPLPEAALDHVYVNSFVREE